MRLTSINTLSLIFALSAVCFPMLSSASTTAQQTNCAPQLQGKHYSVFCFDSTNTARFPGPEVIQACRSIKTLNYEESYEDLGCAANGFSNYFAPSKWAITKINGDGGVDVTGAPNALQVEGAGNALVNVEPNGITRMQILLPAGGILSFDWKNVGGSNLLPPAFQVMVNEEPGFLMETGDGQGRFRSPVRAGDQLTIQFKPEVAASLQLENLTLLSNATGAIKRIWTATDDGGQSNSFTQFITIEQPSIAEVTFPEDLSDIPALPANLSPKATGYPYVDKDGDPTTTNDRFNLNSDNCAFQVEHVDEVQQLSDGCILIRRWVVRDVCGDNTMRETQIIKLSGTPASDDCPGNILYPMPNQNSAKPNSAVRELSSKAYSAASNEWDQHPIPMTL